MKKLLLVLLCAAWLPAQVSLKSIPDISGDSASHQLASSGTARWIQFIAPPGNTSVVRIGDSTVSVTAGLRMAPGSGQMLAPVSCPQGDSANCTIILSSVYYLVQTGDTLSVTWGR